MHSLLPWLKKCNLSRKPVFGLGTYVFVLEMGDCDNDNRGMDIEMISDADSDAPAWTLSSGSAYSQPSSLEEPKYIYI